MGESVSPVSLAVKVTRVCWVRVALMSPITEVPTMLIHFRVLSDGVVADPAGRREEPAGVDGGAAREEVRGKSASAGDSRTADRGNWDASLCISVSVCLRLSVSLCLCLSQSLFLSLSLPPPSPSLSFSLYIHVGRYI